MRIQRTSFFILAALALLLVPFFAMQFHVDGWDWHVTDYAIMAVLLAGAGCGLAAATNTAIPRRSRLIGLAVVGLLCILYVHLAVGIVDSWPLAGS